MSNAALVLSTLAAHVYVIRTHEDGGVRVARSRYRGKKRGTRSNRWTPKQRYPKAKVRKGINPLRKA